MDETDGIIIGVNVFLWSLTLGCIALGLMFGSKSPPLFDLIIIFVVPAGYTVFCLMAYRNDRNEKKEKAWRERLNQM